MLFGKYGGGGTKEDIQQRMRIAKQILGMLRNIRKSAQLSQKTKIRIFICNVGYCFTDVKHDEYQKGKTEICLFLLIKYKKI